MGDLITSSGSSTTLQQGASVLWAIQQNLNYWYCNFDYLGFDNTEGQTINANVNVANPATGNTNFSRYTTLGELLWFGNGNDVSGNTESLRASGPVVSVDIVGHEFTHGVLSHFNGGQPLIPYDSGIEAASIEESLCDIFGTLTEFYSEENGDWTISEDYWLNFDNTQGFLRSLADPRNKPQPPEGTATILSDLRSPDTYNSPYWDIMNTAGFADAHFFNGIQNKWFYLLAEGGEGTNHHPVEEQEYSVCGIGLNKASTILFETLLFLPLIDSTPDDLTYSEMAKFTNQAAGFLFGEDSFEQSELRNAWYAVGVEVLDNADVVITTPSPGVFDLVIRDCNTNKTAGCGVEGYESTLMVDQGDEFNGECNCSTNDGVIYHQDIWDSPSIWNCYKEANADNPYDPSTWDCSGPESANAQEATYQEDVDGNQYHNRLSVEVSNTGCVDYIPGGNPAHLEIYWTFARTGEFWPIHWTGNGYGDWEENTPTDGTALGGMLTDGTEDADIPLDQTIGAGSSRIVSFDWLPPNPNEIQMGVFGIKEQEVVDYGMTPMLCYLARIQSDIDPMFNETANEEAFDNGEGRIGPNVYLNNNIATKNTGILYAAQSNKFSGNAGLDQPDDEGGFPNNVYNIDDIRVTIVNNDVALDGIIDIRFDEIGSNGEQITDYGDLLIYPDRELWTKIETANFAGEGYEVHDAELEVLKMTQGEGFRIDNLDYEGGENRYLGFRFEPDESGKKPPSELLEFKHFLYHTVEYKDPNNNETVNRKGASGINFKSYIGSDSQEENSISDVSTKLIIVPNPTNGITSLSFQLQERSQVEINLYDIQGQLISNIQANTEMESGIQNKDFDASKLAAGLYIVKLKINGETHTQKIVVE